MWNQSEIRGRKKPSKDHKSALNWSKYEMEKRLTIQTLLTATTDKDKHNFMFCNYFGKNRHMPKL